MMRKSRVNGFEIPLAKEQLSTWILYPISTMLFTLLYSLGTSHIYRLSLAVIHSFLVLVVIFTWFIVEYLDPVDGKDNEHILFHGIRVVCFSSEKVSSSQYCAQCNKRIRGLDHHCVWLNTCVGARTYVPFFVLIVVCFIQMILQCIFGLMIVNLLLQKEKKDSHLYISQEAFIGLNLVQIILSVVIATASGALVGFHCYLLLWLRGTTYDYKLQAMGGSLEDDEAFQAKEDERRRKLLLLEHEEARIRDERQKQRRQAGSVEWSYRSIRNSFMAMQSPLRGFSMTPRTMRLPIQLPASARVHVQVQVQNDATEEMKGEVIPSKVDNVDVEAHSVDFDYSIQHSPKASKSGKEMVKSFRSSLNSLPSPNSQSISSLSQSPKAQRSASTNMPSVVPSLSPRSLRINSSIMRPKLEEELSIPYIDNNRGSEPSSPTNASKPTKASKIPVTAHKYATPDPARPRDNANSGRAANSDSSFRRIASKANPSFERTNSRQNLVNFNPRSLRGSRIAEYSVDDGEDSGS